METTITKLIKNKNISISQIARNGNVPKSTLISATKRPVETWTVKTLIAFAEGLEMKGSQLFEMLVKTPYKLKINDEAQTIQSVYIPDKRMFKLIRFTVLNNHMEGWEPTKLDIENLVEHAYNPNPKYLKEYQELFGKK
ncbi:hypothetical protein [Lactobacillus jensenii]|uniref:hypothetical protein n=1 Tax=Lactobacillus jensenii TaxID=109790 RepID=UPI0021BCFE91|nr:hypothetical protein [Lactobacillus jensenii]MDK7308789.1 hypothetical protein [Lactobacillus jensenii]